MKQMAILLTLVTLAVASVNPTRLYWNSTAKTDSMLNDTVGFPATKMLPKILYRTNACTTETKVWSNSPYFALRWNAYVQTNRDSAYFNVLFKYGDQYGWDDAVDTVMTGCVAHGNDDTLRYQPAHWLREFYPPVSYRGYFIFQGTGDNSDSTRIDSVYFLPDLE